MTYMWAFVPIHSKEHLWYRALMLDLKAWLVTDVSVQDVQWSWGQGSVLFLHTKLAKLCLYGPCLEHGGLSCWNRKGPSTNCCHKVGIIKLSKMSVHATALTLRLAEAKGSSPKPKKQPQTIIPPLPNLLLALCIPVGSVLLASTKPRFVHQIAW